MDYIDKTKEEQLSANKQHERSKSTDHFIAESNRISEEALTISQHDGTLNAYRANLGTHWLRNLLRKSIMQNCS
jgi:hypothetical protein